MVRCQHCSAFNQDTPENISDRCWKCQGELSPVNRRAYMRPTLVMLRLEQKTAEAAAKWWKVEEFLEKELRFGNDSEAYALRAFIVQLAEEG
jgi:hypothetical protein